MNREILLELIDELIKRNISKNDFINCILDEKKNISLMKKIQIYHEVKFITM
jgi:hypothetical protein